jgi:hypothetical protein
MSAAGASRVRSTNARATADFDCERPAAPAASPTRSWVRR